MSESKICKDCSANYGDGLFLWLSNKLWKQIGCSKEDYLCARCTINRLENLGINFIYATRSFGKDEIWENFTIELQETEKLRKINKAIHEAATHIRNESIRK